MRSRRGASWRRTGPRQVQGVIKSARSLRLPPGVDPVDVERRITVDAESGELIEDIAAGSYGLRACEAGKRLEAVRDLRVCVDLRDPEIAREFADDTYGAGDTISNGKILEGEYDEHEAGEDLARRGDKVGGYGFMDECSVRDDKLGEGRSSAAAGTTAVIPTNNEPARR